MPITIERYHDFSAGHRVCGHENKCKSLHGHNYRITFTATADTLDELGRIIDFSVLKTALCDWLENNWDHKMILWEKDPIRYSFNCLSLDELSAYDGAIQASDDLDKSIHLVPFNPTAENMADYLLNKIGPEQLKGTPVLLVRVKVEETRKCSAVAELQHYHGRQELWGRVPTVYA
jgi:6-pyruvoyltetrahydropterin/6-carboxytetrahydropterin synthase